MQENGVNKFRTIVSEVSSFVGNLAVLILSTIRTQSNFIKSRMEQGLIAWMYDFNALHDIKHF